MYTEVASKLVVSGTVFSQAVSMAGANGALFEYTIFTTPAGTLTITLEESNDLENWATHTADSARSAIGYFSKKVTSIAGAYVRLKYVSSSGDVIVAAGINTANL
jgi:hypothetical protein